MDLLRAFGEHKELRARKKEGHLIFVARRGDFHRRMAVRGNAALGRAGNLFIGPLSLALRARLIFTRPLLVEIVQSIIGTSPWGRSYLIVEGYYTEVEIITQASAWLLLGRAAHTALPIP